MLWVNQDLFIIFHVLFIIVFYLQLCENNANISIRSKEEYVFIYNENQVKTFEQ